jgi:PD-(D/E)XK nuclease superfamily
VQVKTTKTVKAIAKKWDVDGEELRERLATAAPVIHKWLNGGNAWGSFTRGPLFTEVSVAYNPDTGKARAIPGPSEDLHEYPDVEEGEIPGTVDLLGSLNPQTLLVLDHKSGWAVAADWQPHTPAENGQLRTLATACAALYGAKRVVVAFFHAPANGEPIVLADEMVANDFEAHRKQLRGALARIGNGWLRPGEHCSYCPAWRVCPTNTTSLVELKRAGGPLTSTRVGAIHQAMAEYNYLVDKLRTEIRGWVEAHGVAERPDGKLVGIVERDVERLSKEQIIEALGALKGAKLLDALRKQGALVTKTERHLRIVDR